VAELGGKDTEVIPLGMYLVFRKEAQGVLLSICTFAQSLNETQNGAMWGSREMIQRERQVQVGKGRADDF
jgi:hypothetical protein